MHNDDITFQYVYQMTIFWTWQLMYMTWLFVKLQDVYFIKVTYLPIFGHEKPSRQNVMFWIITSQNHSSIKPLSKHPLGGTKMIFIFAHLACNLWVHVHILVHQYGKMDAKTSKCIFLGWDDYTEGYHCYCPFIREIIISKFIVIHQKHCYHKISNFKKTWSFFKSMHICTNAWLGIFFLTNTYWDIVYVVNLVSWITSLVGSIQNDWVYYLLHQRYTQLWFILQKLRLISSHQI